MTIKTTNADKIEDAKSGMIEVSRQRRYDFYNVGAVKIKADRQQR